MSLEVSNSWGSGRASAGVTGATNSSGTGCGADELMTSAAQAQQIAAAQEQEMTAAQQPHVLTTLSMTCLPNTLSYQRKSN